MKGISSRIFDGLIIFILIIVVIILLYPLYFTIIASFSDPYEVAMGNVTFGVKGFSIESYKQVLNNPVVWTGFRNSIINTLVGTLISVIITIPAAYAISRKEMAGRGIITIFFVVTMYFSGGLLPTYLTVKSLGLINKPYTMIMLGAFSVYNLIIAKTYFQKAIPEALLDAARIDGCSQFRQFISVVLPLSKPLIAVITLFYAVARWNEFRTALIYLNDSKYYPLQMILRNIIIENRDAISTITVEGMSAQEMAFILKRAYMAEAMKYSIIVLASLPMWIIFPFVQKHFSKGMLVGATKY